MNLIKTVLFPILFLSFVHAQGQYGGTIKLKITYEDRPLVGYTITGSINGHDIGGKGVTDGEGNVTLNTSPLPIPNIDVKGVSNCGNTLREWEASGFVYVSPTDGNFYHLRLDLVAKQMNEYTGFPITAIMESFGLNCPGALGGDSGTTTSNTTTSTGTTTSNNNSSTTSIGNSSSNTTLVDNTGKENEVDSAAIKRQQQQDQWKEDWESGKTQAEGLQNQKNLLMNQIAKIDEKISKTNKLLQNDKLATKEQNEYLYDIKELEIERQIKELKLEKVKKEIAAGNTVLVGSERRYYKEKDDELNEELKKVQQDRKNGVSLIENKEDDEVISFSEAEIKNMSSFELKKNRVKIKSSIQKKKLVLQSKGKLMKQDAITQLENDINILETTLRLMENEIEEREKAELEKSENED